MKSAQELVEQFTGTQLDEKIMETVDEIMGPEKERLSLSPEAQAFLDQEVTATVWHTMGALEKLNEACHEEGVCEPRIKHAAELWKEGSPRKIIVACWEDGAITSCVIETASDKRECCYTAAVGGEELYYAWLAHLSSPEVGHKVKSIEVEGEASLETESIQACSDAPC